MVSWSLVCEVEYLLVFAGCMVCATLPLVITSFVNLTVHVFVVYVFLLVPVEGDIAEGFILVSQWSYLC